MIVQNSLPHNKIESERATHRDALSDLGLTQAEPNLLGVDVARASHALHLPLVSPKIVLTLEISF